MNAFKLFNILILIYPLKFQRIFIIYISRYNEWVNIMNFFYHKTIFFFYFFKKNISLNILNFFTFHNYVKLYFIATYNYTHIKLHIRKYMNAYQLHIQQHTIIPI